MAVNQQSKTTPLQELLQRGRAAELAARDRLRATRQRWDMSTPGRAVNKAADTFFGWLFSGWGGEDYTVWSPPRPPTAEDITAATDAAFARKAAADQLTPAPEAADTRTQPEPQDLDALGDWAAPPPVVGYSPPPPPPLDVTAPGVEWCNCTGLAHDAHCRNQNAVTDLNLGGLLPPSPPGTTAPEPSPAQP